MFRRTTHRPEKTPSIDELSEWCVSEFAQRADSVDAQAVVSFAEQYSMGNADVMWEFFTSQWPIAVDECGVRFGKAAASPILMDRAAMERAIRRAVPVLWPVSSEGVADEVVARVRKHLR